MDTVLSLKQLSDITERNPTALVSDPLESEGTPVAEAALNPAHHYSGFARRLRASIQRVTTTARSVPDRTPESLASAILTAFDPDTGGVR
jgi:hypothetical protein